MTILIAGYEYPLNRRNYWFGLDELLVAYIAVFIVAFSCFHDFLRKAGVS